MTSAALALARSLDPALLTELQRAFAQQLLEEESVFVLPGQCFGTPNYFRIVTCPPVAKLGEAFDRIAAFCERLAAA